MKNTLVDLQNHLFEMMERLNDDSLDDGKLKQEIARSLAFSELAKIAVANGSLMAKCIDLLYGIPVSDNVPLIPKAKEAASLGEDTKRRLIAVPKPRGDVVIGYKRGKRQLI